ncbi:MAG TPA: PAS domain-containing protein [Terriglobia bacterium]|nr:PAS domain-containing protein [Terriglobia bacterium]
MALFRNAAQPLRQTEWWRFPSTGEKYLQDISHMSLLVFAAAAVAAGILAGISLSSDFGIGLSSSFVVVALLFPLLCGWLAKEVWQVRKLEDQIRGQEARLGKLGSAVRRRDNTPVGFLIVSQDMRVRFANQKYLESTLQEPEEVLGYKVEDVFSAETLEDEADALLRRSDPAASCCFDASIRTGLAGERPVHITMTRIAPRKGEGCVLVIVEDLLPDAFRPDDKPAKRYVC